MQRETGVFQHSSPDAVNVRSHTCDKYFKLIPEFYLYLKFSKFRADSAQITPHTFSWFLNLCCHLYNLFFNIIIIIVFNQYLKQGNSVFYIKIQQITEVTFQQWPETILNVFYTFITSSNITKHTVIKYRYKFFN